MIFRKSRSVIRAVSLRFYKITRSCCSSVLVLLLLTISNVVRAQSPVLQLEKPKPVAPAQAPEIGKCKKYRATAAWVDGAGATVWILERTSDRVVATLRGSEEYDHLGNVGRRAVFSSDGELIAYSIGTASAGTELRLFRVRSNGQSENIPLHDKSQDLENRAWDLVKRKMVLPDEAFAAHVYCVPVIVSSVPLAIIFDLAGDYVSPDHKQPRFETTRFRYGFESKKLEIVRRPTQR